MTSSTLNSGDSGGKISIARTAALLGLAFFPVPEFVAEQYTFDVGFVLKPEVAKISRAAMGSGVAYGIQMDVHE